VVRHTVRVFAKSLVFEAVGVGDVVEGGAWEDEVQWEVVQDVGTLTGYRARAEVDELMCGIDGGVMEECPKREARYLYRFWGCDVSVNCRGFAACVAIVCAVAASVAAAVLTLVKVFWWLLLMCQVGWIEVGVDVILACSAVLLFSSGCTSWYFFTDCGACTLLTGSQVLLLSG
jgi:hypothetical protein